MEVAKRTTQLTYIDSKSQEKTTAILEEGCEVTISEESKPTSSWSLKTWYLPKPSTFPPIPESNFSGPINPELKSFCTSCIKCGTKPTFLRAEKASTCQGPAKFHYVVRCENCKLEFNYVGTMIIV